MGLSALYKKERTVFLKKRENNAQPSDFKHPPNADGLRCTVLANDLYATRQTNPFGLLGKLLYF